MIRKSCDCNAGRRLWGEPIGGGRNGHLVGVPDACRYGASPPRTHGAVPGHGTTHRPAGTEPRSRHLGPGARPQSGDPLAPRQAVWRHAQRFHGLLPVLVLFEFGAKKGVRCAEITATWGSAHIPGACWWPPPGPALAGLTGLPCAPRADTGRCACGGGGVPCRSREHVPISACFGVHCRAP